jgi:hypothetical protein
MAERRRLITVKRSEAGPTVAFDPDQSIPTVFRVMIPSLNNEEPMTNSEFYFLVLVIGAFGAFAVAMVIATLKYKAWLRQPRQSAAYTARSNSSKAATALAS